MMVKHYTLLDVLYNIFYLAYIKAFPPNPTNPVSVHNPT